MGTLTRASRVPTTAQRSSIYERGVLVVLPNKLQRRLGAPRPDRLQVRLLAHHDYAIADLQDGVAVWADLQLARGALQAEHDNRTQCVQNVVDGAAGETRFLGDLHLAPHSTPAPTRRDRIAQFCADAGQ